MWSFQHWPEYIVKEFFICLHAWCTNMKISLSDFEIEIAVTAHKSQNNFSSWRHCNQCCLLSSPIQHTHTHTNGHVHYIHFILLLSALDQVTVLRKTQFFWCTPIPNLSPLRRELNKLNEKLQVSCCIRLNSPLKSISVETKWFLEAVKVFISQNQ